jgi:hypothetical protein
MRAIRTSILLTCAACRADLSDPDGVCAGFAPSVYVFPAKHVECWSTDASRDWHLELAPAHAGALAAIRVTRAHPSEIDDTTCASPWYSDRFWTFTAFDGAERAEITVQQGRTWVDPALMPRGELQVTLPGVDDYVGITCATTW